jgi:hypothetical protein
VPFVVAAPLTLALIVNCVAESMVKMRVLFGISAPVLVTNMPTLRFVVVVFVTIAVPPVSVAVV